MEKCQKKKKKEKIDRQKYRLLTPIINCTCYRYFFCLYRVIKNVFLSFSFFVKSRTNFRLDSIYSTRLFNEKISIIMRKKKKKEIILTEREWELRWKINVHFITGNILFKYDRTLLSTSYSKLSVNNNRSIHRRIKHFEQLHRNVSTLRLN